MSNPTAPFEGLDVIASSDRPNEPFAVRVPLALRRRVRIYCVEHDREVMEFVAEAIREALAAQRSTP
jgi:hypothetical protein